MKNVGGYSRVAKAAAHFSGRPYVFALAGAWWAGIGSFYIGARIEDELHFDRIFPELAG